MARILLVDDEPDIITVAEALLKRNSYEVIKTCDGEECLKKLKEEKVDLILLDVMMPGENGWEVCKKIKAEERTKDLPVVLFTVRTSPDSIAKGKEYGADAQIDKPYSSEELLSTVKDVLTRSMA